MPRDVAHATAFCYLFRVQHDVSAAPRLRLALVTGSLPLGGSTTFLCNFAGELVRRQIPVEVVSFEKENPLASDFARLQIPVVALDQRRAIYEDRALLVLRHLNEFRPTAVLANLSPSSFEVLRYVPAGVFRIGIGQSDDPQVYATLRRYAGHMDLLAVVSRRMAQIAKTFSEFRRVPVACLPYGVPLAEAAPAARDFQRPLRILYLGRLDREQKRVHLFPEIFARLASSGVPFHWTVAGDGPERAALERAMTSPRPGQTVSFPGRIDYGEVPRLLAGHDIFLLASDYEGLPLSLLEAMGAGLVPVVSDLESGIREVVDETSGRLVAPGNTAGFAEAIAALHGQRGELRRLSQNARERVRHDFSVAAMTDRWLQALPASPNSEVRWPERWTIKPIITAPDPWRYSPPIRLLRRLLIRLRPA